MNPMDLSKKEFQLLIDALNCWHGEFYGIADMTDVEKLCEKMETFYEKEACELQEIRPVVQKQREEGS